MSSETSTDAREPREDAGFEIWHFYVLISMVAATAAVMLARNTHPVALLLLSSAVVAAGFVGLTIHRALAGFAGDESVTHGRLRVDARAGLEQEKALTLRSIKELEFDRAMGKVSDRDFEEIGRRLRARALTIMEELDRAEQEPVSTKPAVPESEALAKGTCEACQTPNDADAKFCKQCGAKL